MNFKRPSLFSVLIVSGVAFLILALILGIVKYSSSSKENNEQTMNKIDSISGEENIVLDSEGNRINSATNVLSQKEVDSFIFDSFDIITKSGITTLTFEIYNPDENDKRLGEYELKILDELGNTVGRIVDNADVLEGLQRKEVSLELKGDISNLSDIQISKIVYEEI